MPTDLSILLKRSASEHSHLCPRQVLGVRMGLAGLDALGVKPPVTTKTALVYIETDGCFADGIRAGDRGDGWSPHAAGAGPGDDCSHLHRLEDPEKRAAGTQVGHQERALGYAP